MNKQLLELVNVVHWDEKLGDRVYMDAVHIAVEAFPFDNRHVFVRFIHGPRLDLSIWDMDRLVEAYQLLRSRASLTLDNVKKPERCDFTVSILPPVMKNCRRCGNGYADDGDGFNGFCPNCADHLFSRVCSMCDQPVAWEAGHLHHVTDEGSIDRDADQLHKPVCPDT